VSPGTGAPGRGLLSPADRLQPAGGPQTADRRRLKASAPRPAQAARLDDDVGARRQARLFCLPLRPSALTARTSSRALVLCRADQVEPVIAKTFCTAGGSRSACRARAHLAVRSTSRRRGSWTGGENSPVPRAGRSFPGTLKTGRREPITPRKASTEADAVLERQLHRSRNLRVTHRKPRLNGSNTREWRSPFFIRMAHSAGSGQRHESRRSTPRSSA